MIPSPALELTGVAKSFTMHLQEGLRLPVVDGVDFSVAPGQCVVLSGPSGTGKSTILMMIFGNYRCDGGEILVRAEPLLAAPAARAEARAKAAALLERLAIPQRLWQVPPITFSGGEQQRVNIARGFLLERPLLLLDEPTASLDAENRATVVELIAERKRRGSAIVAIVHDEDVRAAIADAVVDVTRFSPAA